MESVQLTERNSESVWKTKDKGMILMVDMSDEHLQSALVLVHKRKVESIIQFQLDCKLEEQLMSVAKARNFILKELDECKDTFLAMKYTEMKDLLKTVKESIKRKLKQKV